MYQTHTGTATFIAAAGEVRPRDRDVKHVGFHRRGAEELPGQASDPAPGDAKDRRTLLRGSQRRHRVRRVQRRVCMNLQDCYMEVR